MAKPPLRSSVTFLIILGVLFLGMQFLRPELTNPPVKADLQAPPEVKQILRNSCYNCHSNETRLPWYDKVVPAYWIVTSDVTTARQHLNFSELGSLPPAAQKAKLYEAVNQIQLGAMPLPAYTKVHPEATVTEAQLKVLRDYLAPASLTTPAETATANEQYGKWLPNGTNLTQTHLSPNGVPFLPDYKNWKAISSTDRFDNHTMREILGNDIAIKAIAENHINPWPDGTVLAKVTWFQQPDDKGFVHAGAFQQVELMERDSRKYAATGNWGYGRWRGTELKPYGNDAKFDAECVGCHTPVKKNDYVYTMPIAGQGKGQSQ